MATRFEPGAPPPAGTIPLSVPVLHGNEWSYVKECLDTGWVSSAGPFVDRFERDVARRVGTHHAVATVNGTAALHLALIAAGVERGDEVIVPSLTFIAPANAVRYVGARPVFLDVDPEYWQLDPGAVAAFLRDECRIAGGEAWNKETGARVKAILPVDILGHPVDLDPLLTLARADGLAVVQDSTESLGSLYKGRPVGADADIACFSFNGNKIITAGGGGMVVTRDEALAARVRYLSTQAKDDPSEYVHGDVGYNYRLTNLQAAVGCAQLEQLDDHVRRKRAIARSYAKALGGVPGIGSAPEAPWARSTFWLYTILVDASVSRTSSRSLISTLRSKHIESRPLWQPLHRSPAHAWKGRDRPVSERIVTQGVSLPSSPNLTSEDQERVIDAVRDAA